jgi:hypothetical protein
MGSPNDRPQGRAGDRAGALPVTDVVRTVIDLASVLPVPTIRKMVDHLVVAGTATIDDFADVVMELARQASPA